MEFIRNTRGGISKLEELHRSAIQQTERIQAAIAYATDERPFLEMCWQEKKPLLFYGRYDYTCPIAPAILDWFLSKSSQSANYELRLVPDIFHPKVIWWRNVGAYIGSQSETPERLFMACFDSARKVPHIGVSTLGEMAGWAMPDEFPPRNGRTSKALTALGYDVAIHSE